MHRRRYIIRARVMRYFADAGIDQLNICPQFFRFYWQGPALKKKKKNIYCTPHRPADREICACVVCRGLDAHTKR